MNDFQDVYIDRIDIKSALTGRLPNDPPLLQELGIDFTAIKNETKLILNPNANFEKSDITGPLIFMFFYALCLFANGKMHFGYVYFITLSSNLLIYFLLNVIKTTQKGVEFVKCFSILGYSFVPVMGFAFINIILAPFKYILGIFAAFWSCYVASIVFCRYLEMEDKKFIIGYPILLVYICYVLLVVF
ncbi:hypothetical protein EDEG_01189 [Edhazardia aedis USNM 41457]|uniref:Protein YIP n=1 Tax=Edhazardia aedis (strain USNM 41457) TaxID=1003232 RepID=J9DPY2_EDHAE|nr:hypothetical protein EDEG_01189 [Edhazardia aedis USNM 41457]|eukprot:EJW04605.1 hypothetical protein EDEG_01189 [Edhazardia aedis USNM 41457]